MGSSSWQPSKSRAKRPLIKALLVLLLSARDLITAPTLAVLALSISADATGQLERFAPSNLRAVLRL